MREINSNCQPFILPNKDIQKKKKKNRYRRNLTQMGILCTKTDLCLWKTFLHSESQHSSTMRRWRLSGMQTMCRLALAQSGGRDGALRPAVTGGITGPPRPHPPKDTEFRAVRLPQTCQSMPILMEEGLISSWLPGLLVQRPDWES